MLGLARSALRVLPVPVRREGRHLLNRVGLWWDRAAGRTTVRRPPAEFVTGIGGGWEVGDAFLRHFRNLADLKPGEAVLDAGCGVGRMAVPLIPYLGPAGRYEGFDIIRDYVRWCRRAITPRWPNFRFTHADIFNREYNPRGPVRAGEYRFPYPGGSFDFAFLTSVFTHLMPPDAAHYLAEVGRVLKPGGRALATFFLLNGESNRLVDAGRGRFTLFPAEGVYRVHRRDIPEACIALDEGFVEGAIRAAGLTLDRPVRYGDWCGRPDGYDFQDILILRKR
ncbi:MAG: class I SAM-dependent methyltransferase [Gemmataceae bacterium]|nr:class I SAM-dependent methyltransferase [Gemmataceae bacterium]